MRTKRKGVRAWKRPRHLVRGYYRRRGGRRELVHGHVRRNRRHGIRYKKRIWS